jgi:hypothetical protein
MTLKTKRISTLIESQLPDFISSEYELFGKFLRKYYASQEVQGGPLDVITNIQKYADIDYYEKNILKQSDVLAVSISATDTTITLNDAGCFPDFEGYVRIDNEIIFYREKVNNQLIDCVRGVSGNTTLGDLYDNSNFISTEASSHNTNKPVYNISNLFLYAFVKNFETQYLGSFPEKYLKGEIDKRTLIKNIQKFYKSKGTKSSIKFIFNTIIAKDIENKPSVYNPRDFTYKSSESDWINVYSLKVKVISGDPKLLIGSKITQEKTDEYEYASATVDNVYPDGTSDGEKIWNIVLAPETVNGSFAISTKTRLEKELPNTYKDGDRIDVFSTIGWQPLGKVLIGEETIEFKDKNVTQFVILNRGQVPSTHKKGVSVYKPVLITGSSVTLLTLGVVYNLTPAETHPYSSSGDTVQVSNPGFETADVKIVKTGTNQPRWIFSDGSDISVQTDQAVENSLRGVSSNVSAIFADDQYYYITSSSFPSYDIFDGSIVTEKVQDQKLLKIVRKEAISTTEVYKTPKRDVGILLNGVPLYGYKDQESIRYGKIQQIKVNTRGRNYANPPFVLIDGVPNKARAVLTGQVVDRIIVDTNETFTRTPSVEIVSGRGAKVRAIVTGGKITSLVIDDPGEFYSSPPIVRIRDLSGKGRFAEFNSIVDTNGQLTGFNKISEGSFYNKDNVVVDILEVGRDATAVVELKEWNKNRFNVLKNNLDQEYGYFLKNYNNVLNYGYAQLANPKSLRVSLGDNLNNAGTEPSVKTHSPILGFAYDGNPIYGPFGYQNPVDNQSPIVRMTSSYSLKGGRKNGPSTSKYPLGYFIDDYAYSHKSGSLDENNGRYCITPDFPKGVYAYFITIDSNQVPQFPYIIGDNFYSLPVDSNYNSDINQNDIPKNAKRFFVPGMPRNGEGLIAQISEVKTGGVDKISVERSSKNFSVNSKVYFDNRGTEGSEVEAVVSSVKGKDVNYLQSKENKVVKLTTIQNAYLFADDVLRQPDSNASGEIVGTVQNDNVIVLKNVVGTFNNTGTFSADIKTFILILDQDSSYTKGATLKLTDGINPPIATGEVLEGTSRQNTVQIKVLSGTWIVDDNYFLQSSNLFNTSGTKISVLTSLSDNLEPFEVNQNVALIETSEEHGLGVGDTINIDINPDDSTKTKTYYVRKRLYQDVKFRTFSKETVINYSGVGKFTILNGGFDYTEGTYSNVPLTGGSGSGATALIEVSDAGIVSSIIIQDGGSGYRRGDYLSVDDDQLDRSGASLSSSRLTLYVDHAGVASDASLMPVKSTNGLSEGDFLKVGNEIIQISSISGNILSILRAKEGTEALNHFDGQSVSIYNPRYNFADNFKITNDFGSGYIKNYNPETQEATIVFDYSVEKLTARNITISTTFFDSSTPKRLVKVESVSSVGYKFEISEDNINFISNPNLSLQEYYKYIFDTSHSSLTGTYFDLSPSKSYNLLTLEKVASNILPGNPGSFTDLKFGFGSRLEQNNYDKKVSTNFSNFYYFDKNGIVNSEGAILKIIQDPLQGTKTANYVTPTRFVYDLSSVPLWDGSGNISYTTNGQFAVGEVNSVSIINFGLNYKKLPVILGCDPNKNFRGKATVLFDLASNKITGVRIDEKGSNYVNPKVIIVDGDGEGAEFNVVARDGQLFSITVKNPGKNYTYAPSIEIIESDVNFYPESNTIGIPQSISITRNGGSFHLDKTVSSRFTSKFVLSLTGITDNFQKGEQVIQIINGVEVSRSTVSEWRIGSNLLKVEKVSGILREGVPLSGTSSFSSAVVKNIFVTTFEENITSFYDNLGFYKSDKGRLGVSNQKITDSFFYQDYSYVVQSKTPIDQWRDLIKATTHPSGFKLFGQVDIEGSAKSEMPSGTQNKASHFTSIQLWDSDKNRITVESTRRIVTQTIQKVENTRIRRGQGSAATSEFNFNETRAFNFTLSAPFDGYYDTDGRLQGTNVFQVIDDNGNVFFPISAESLIVTLDGILQEPNVAYTVSQDKIIFSQPPLGQGTKLTGNNNSDITTYKGTKFYGRSFYFKGSQYNNRYIRKIRNIFQRNGRWLDAANQIERNRQFIIEESIGYGKDKHPIIDWSTKLDDYSYDIEYILDAYQHDLRFGGNTKTVDYANIFAKEADYIKKNKSQSLDIFNYATKLTKLAVNNWDYIDQAVTYIAGLNKINVTDSRNLVVGMYISSGRAYPSGTKIISIDSQTQVTLSSAAIANSGVGPGGASDGLTSISGPTSGNSSILTNTAVVEPGDTFSVTPGDTFVVPVSFSGLESATFYLSGINSGTFYDASNLIEANKSYLQEEISEYIYDNYLLQLNKKQKCHRDLGYLIDAIVFHLRFGGNQKVVNFAQLYFTNNGYPYGEELTYISTNPEETAAAIDAWNKLEEKMILAMRNNLGAGSYTSIPPYVDLTIAADNQFPSCIEVEASINNMIDIVKDIIKNGTGSVEITETNDNKSGNWTPLKSYSNYNIIADPLLNASECANVISSIGSLYSNLNDILNSKSVTKTRPDYVDGENKEFDLYWEDGSPVISEKDENLLLTINAVLQETKFNASYPGDDSYYINRTVIPNRLVFDVAPIWDQDSGAKTLGEPTAVEKISGVGIGNYKRLTIDSNLVDNQRRGPFLILDLEDLTVQSVDEPDYLLVFIDSVLQREGDSYRISGPNIYFNFPITEQMKVDMRYLYGRDVGQILNIYDYNPDLYYAQSKVTLNVTSNLNAFASKFWMGSYAGDTMQVYQILQNGSYNVIGEVYNLRVFGSTISFNCFGYKAEIIDGIDIHFVVKGKYDYNIAIGIDHISSEIIYETDEEGRLLLRGNDQYWRGTFLRDTYKNPFVSLSNNTKIRVEGEDNFRTIKKLPSTLTSKEQRNQQQVSNSFFASVDIDSYNGITRGEGLSIVAEIENGSVVNLSWNQRSYNPVTQPTAYQYFTPPVVNFIPEDGNGGGARAKVIVSKGQVLSVELIDGGSGYTQPPRVIVARRYDVLEETDIGVSVIKIGINPVAKRFNIISSSVVNLLGNQVSGVNTFTSILFRSPKDTDRVITAQIQLVEETGNDLSASLDQLATTIENNKTEIPVIGAFTQTNEYISVISGRVQDVITNSIVTAKRQITSIVHNVIQNTSLSNVNYYEVAAFLDVQLDPVDSIVYIADTSKFKTNGYLLIGNEVVRYMRKLNDRFLMVQRAQNGTTAQMWPAGTYIRQIPDPVSIAPAGVVNIEASSQIVTLKGGSEIGGSEKKFEKQVVTPIVSSDKVYRTIETRNQIGIDINSVNSVTTSVRYKFDVPFNVVPKSSISYKETMVSAQIQIVSTEISVSREKTEVLVIPPPSGIIDGYAESIFITDPISTRVNGFVDITNEYGVVKRDTSIVFVTNSVLGKSVEYLGNYTTSNAGPTLGNWYASYDDGSSGVSNLTISQFSSYYASLTLSDFVDRKKSSYTKSGLYFNLANPSIQNPVTISNTSGSVSTSPSISVQSTTYFSASGYIFTSGGSLIQYTSKTDTSFEGCTLISGPDLVNSGDEIVPQSIN